MSPAAPGSTTTTTTNAVNRLTADTVKTGTVLGSGTAVSSDSYAYDLNGNLTQQVTAGTTTNYGYNAADQMCWSGSGTSATCTPPPYAASYTYDGNGNTLSGDATTGTNTFSNGLLDTTTHRAGGVSNQQYVRDNKGNLIALLMGGASYCYTVDDIGSVLQLTDSAGNNAATYKYGPYGKTLTATGAQASTNPYRYASGYTDTTGLIKFGVRYYNPTLTRFTHPTPAAKKAIATPMRATTR